MRWKTLVGGILGVATMMVLAGCGPSTASEPAGEVAAPEGETAPVATEAPTGGQAAGACANVFYPVVDGATWTYDGSVDPIGPYTYTETVTEVQPDGFTLSGDFGEVTRLQEWSCTAEGLIAVDVPGGGTTANVAGGGATLVLTTVSSTGVTLPVDLAPGLTWSQTYEVEGEQTLPTGASSTAAGTAQVTSTAVGMESVSVPAGTFSALRIDRQIQIDLVVDFAGSSIPVQFASSETVYFAEDVGMIRSNSTATFAGEAFEDRQELSAYAVP